MAVENAMVSNRFSLYLFASLTDNRQTAIKTNKIKTNTPLRCYTN